MALDWDIYSKKIVAQVKANKSELFSQISSSIEDFIDENVYWTLEDMRPLFDLERDDFTMRLSWDGCVDKKDDKNIMFSLKEEISDYDGGDLERLDRLKVIFQNCLVLIDSRTKELEEQWGRD